MKLNIVERLALLNILPEQGSIATLRIVNDLRMSLAPSEEEHEEYNIVQKGTQITWDSKKGDIEVEIPIGEKATDIIIDVLKKLDSEEQLTTQHIPIYDKFIKG